MYIKLSDKHVLWHLIDYRDWTACGQRIDQEKRSAPALDADIPKLKICSKCRASGRRQANIRDWKQKQK